MLFNCAKIQKLRTKNKLKFSQKVENKIKEKTKFSLNNMNEAERSVDKVFFFIVKEDFAFRNYFKFFN